MKLLSVVGGRGSPLKGLEIHLTSEVRKMAAVDPRWPERLPVKVNKVEVGGEVRGHSIRRPSRPAVSWSVWREGCRCDW